MKVEEAKDLIQRAYVSAGMNRTRLILMFSGGKDSIVMAHLARQVLGKNLRAFTEVSMVPPYIVDEVKLIAEELNLKCYFHSELSDPEAFAERHWIEQNPPTKWKPSNLDKHRHWPSMRRFIKKKEPTLVLFGRRTQENNVPSPMYRKKGELLLNCHPIYNWTTEEVFQYIDENGLSVPSCYAQGYKHLLTVVSMARMAYKESKSIDHCFDVWRQHLPEYLTAASKVDERVRDYLKANPV